MQNLLFQYQKMLCIYLHRLLLFFHTFLCHTFLCHTFNLLNYYFKLFILSYFES
ncbi:171R [Invertebrate iridescent virus 6]|uniref:171R n=1 Tax=Invertebrate iridescent virus 6 TaxID=176652 RepID=Q91FZ0_IIV6|nr:171R [Invertebrate iridescent virus 6]AAK82042.1 171R [Invertebrate iridescent virus 6]